MIIGDFHYPKINYRFWLSQHGDNNSDFIGLGLTTRLSNLQKVNPTISQEVINLTSMNDAVVFIKNKISKLEKTDQDYLDIFDAINNWGGKTIQRGIIYSGITLRNNINIRNWFGCYKLSADLLGQKDNFLNGIAMMLKVPGLGVSFGSKHFAFWSYDNSRTAIYDSKISQILLRSRTPKKKDVLPFIESINTLANNHPEFCHNMMPNEIEKALFAFHKYYWTNSGFWLLNEAGEDYDVAIQINECFVTKLK
jgi:hypothetical protein